MSLPPPVPQMFGLKGRIALVTGGCQNFGWEIATGLAEAGANVAVTSREADKAAAAADRLAKAHGVKTLGIPMNLRDEASIAEAFKAVVASLGTPDILVNNAGGHAPATGKLETETLDSWQTFIDINLTGTFLCIREAARLMIPLKRGAIVNIASGSSLIGRDRSEIGSAHV